VSASADTLHVCITGEVGVALPVTA